VGERHRPIRARSAPGQVAGAATENSRARSPSSKTACDRVLHNRTPGARCPATTRAGQGFLRGEFSCPESEQCRIDPVRVAARVPRFVPIRQRRRCRRRWLLRKASDSQVRLQATANRAASEHAGVYPTTESRAVMAPGRSMARGCAPLAICGAHRCPFEVTVEGRPPREVVPLAVEI
jgi:hypothetical protein